MNVSKWPLDERMSIGHTAHRRFTGSWLDFCVNLGETQRQTLAAEQETQTSFLSLSSVSGRRGRKDTAESWCCQPELDALSHSCMRHLSGPAPPPCCSLSSRYTSVVRGHMRWAFLEGEQMSVLSYGSVRRAAVE
ncbi:unnamed protein product [Pleuronectes platessa]|uniref:Uncharacterized protein n=1 Tax=Pleuronectes platessa TaxID=8262 RepID=A0A9N7UW43_PLEPL|nr:unnamed protein product [Pleuronectes platessa]